jgi:hypothetical protein
MCFLSWAHVVLLLLLRGSAARWAIFMLDSFLSRRDKDEERFSMGFSRDRQTDHLYTREGINSIDFASPDCNCC